MYIYNSGFRTRFAVVLILGYVVRAGDEIENHAWRTSNKEANLGGLYRNIWGRDSRKHVGGDSKLVQVARNKFEPAASECGVQLSLQCGGLQHGNPILLGSSAFLSLKASS